MHNHPQRHAEEGAGFRGNSLERSRRGLLVAIGVTGSIMVLEFVGGILSNSLALLSDAGHMLTDVLALVLSLVALYMAERPPSRTKTYGLYRMEILAALVNGTSLILITLFILYEAYRRFQRVEQVASETMLLVATIGLVANGVAALAIMRSSGESLNIRGAYLHILGDALSSVGVIVGGVVILLTGWYIVDPILSVLICGVILKGSISLVKESVNILLEAAPKDLDIAEIQKEIQAVPGVKGMHDVHLWTITSGFHAMSAHLLIDDILVSRASEILDRVNEILRQRYGIVHTTIQVECESCQEGFYCDLDRNCVSVGRVGHTH